VFTQIIEKLNESTCVTYKIPLKFPLIQILSASASYGEKSKDSIDIHRIYFSTITAQINGYISLVFSRKMIYLK